MNERVAKDEKDTDGLRMTDDRDRVAQSPLWMTPTPTDPALCRPTLTFDPAEYERYVVHLGLSQKQKTELLATMWTIVGGFVDLGFNVHPVQQALAATKTLAVDSPSVVPSAHVSENNTELAADGPSRPVAREDES